MESERALHSNPLSLMLLYNSPWRMQFEEDDVALAIDNCRGTDGFGGGPVAQGV